MFPGKCLTMTETQTCKHMYEDMKVSGCMKTVFRKDYSPLLNPNTVLTKVNTSKSQ